MAGVIEVVKQSFDPTKAHTANAGLDYIHKIINGVLSTTPEFQRPDGTFNYPRCILGNAEHGNGHLNFEAPQ